jgi:queuosine precursor transporter
MNTKLAVTIFIAAIVAANLTIAAFGPWFSPINALLLIGLDLSLRDHLHDRWRHQLWRMGVLIGTAGIISWVLNPAAGRIAIASTVAFTVAGLADAAVYHRLIDLPWLRRSNGSNVAGAATDSILFPLIAFGWFPGLLAIIGLQFAAKTAGGFVWSLALNPWRSRVPARHES